MLGRVSTLAGWAGLLVDGSSRSRRTAASPTRSTISGVWCMYLGASVRTHLGMVAEKRHVCRSACEHVPRMAFMSSWSGVHYVMYYAMHRGMHCVMHYVMRHVMHHVVHHAMHCVMHHVMHHAVHCVTPGSPCPPRLA